MKIFIGHDKEVREQGFRFVELLKTAAKARDLKKGTGLHTEISKKRLLGKSSYVASALIAMYMQCGMSGKAEQVLDELPVWDVPSWNALLSGYSQQGQGHEALSCFERMQEGGLLPNMVTFTSLLKACGTLEDVNKGREIHEELLCKGWVEKKLALSNALVTMYVKCGATVEARRVMESFCARDVVSWNALIAGYAQEGKGHEAIKCFEEMQREGLFPNAITFSCILKACGTLKDVSRGKQIHEEILRAGLLEENIVLGNALVDMYAKCGMLTKARELLQELPIRNIVSWNALISGYAQHEQGHEALGCYSQMQRDGLSPNEVTFVCILKVCGCMGAIDKGKEIHDEILHKGLLERNIALGTALVDMYAQCGALARAQRVLDELPVQNVVCWSALIARYAQQGQGYEALKCFESMKKGGFTPNEVTLVCALKACGDTGAIEKGEQIHADIAECGLLEKNIVLGNALVDMYVKCGMIRKAREVLGKLSARNVATWNIMIAGYAQHKQGYEALDCFSQMHREGISPDEITFCCILKASASIGDLGTGKEIHELIVDRGLLEKNNVLANALMDMYARCDEISRAQEVFDDLPGRDLVSWNVLITGYVQAGHGREALDCLSRMQSEGFSPNEVTFTCILKACGIVGSASKGKQIHHEIANRGFLKGSLVLGSGLVDMYAKCGVLERARQVLEDLSLRDTISWSALITGYSQAHKYDEALNCFRQMQREGLAPNGVTFLCVLNACSQTGKLIEARVYYEMMSRKYGITPQLEHHSCMVVMLGNAGHFDEAVSVIKTIPSPDQRSVWLALLSACKKWGNVMLGRLVFEEVIQLADDLAPAYTIMADIYAAAGMLEDAEKIRAVRMNKAPCG
jgi:pentatricopeptide repeat protein